MIITPGATSVSTYFHLRKAADGTDYTGAVITDIDLTYTRSGASPAAKVDATALATPYAAYAANKAIEVNATNQPGVYRVDWPDAAFAAGVRGVVLTVKLATAFTEDIAVELRTDPLDAAGTATATQTGLTNQGYTTTRAPYLDDIETLKTLVDVATSTAATPTEVQDAIQGAVDSLVATFDNPTTPTAVQQLILDALSEAYAAAAAAQTEASAAIRHAALIAEIDTRLATGDYTPPDNAGIAAIQERTDNLPDAPASVGSAMTLTSAYSRALAAASLAELTAAKNALLTDIHLLNGVTIAVDPLYQPSIYDFSVIRDVTYTKTVTITPSLPAGATAYRFSIRYASSRSVLLSEIVTPTGNVFSLAFKAPPSACSLIYDIEPAVDVEQGIFLPTLVTGKITVTEDVTLPGDWE